jgi:hypothetical protein
LQSIFFLSHLLKKRQKNNHVALLCKLYGQAIVIQLFHFRASYGSSHNQPCLAAFPLSFISNRLTPSRSCLCRQSSPLLQYFAGYIASEEFPAFAGKTTEFKTRYKLGSGFRLSGNLLKDVGLRPSANREKYFFVAAYEFDLTQEDQ